MSIRAPFQKAGGVAGGLAVQHDGDGAMDPASLDAARGAVWGGDSLVKPNGDLYKPALISTWSALPLASAYVGNAFVTDVGPHGSLWRSDGSTWGPVGGTVLLAQGANLTVGAGSTAEEDIVSLTLPGGLMGATGQLEVVTFWTATNNANAKTTRVKLGGTAFLATTGVVSNAIYMPPPTRIWNLNAQNSQVSFAAANGNSSVATGTAATTGTVDTSAAATLAISGQKATGSDTLTLYAYSVRLVRP
jgi:hypothetical protein